jgi:hypothetical protein
VFGEPSAADFQILELGDRRAQHAAELCLTTRDVRAGGSALLVDGEGVSVAGGCQEVVLIASFPLSDADWHPLAEGEVIAICAGQLSGSRRP